MIESNSTHLGNESHTNKNEGEPASIEAADAFRESAEKRIQELETQVKEKENKYVYLYADFENFKKRAIKERSDLIKFGWESVARDLLQTLDNLERALAHVSPDTEKTLVEGLQMILGQFKDSLQKQGVRPIESLNKEFDPNLHEAVGQEKSELPSGTVVKEHTPGYTLHGRLLRPARVLISEGPGEIKST